MTTTPAAPRTPSPHPTAPAKMDGVSPKRSRQLHNFGSLPQAFRALSMTQKAGWWRIAETLNQRQGRVGRKRLSACNVFSLLGSARLAAGLDIPTDAPANLDPPPMLGRITAQARLTSTGALSLTVISSRLACPVLLLGAAPTPGKPTFPDSSFQPLGALPNGFAEGANEIGMLYAAVYRRTEVGAQIAVKLVAMTDAGVRGPELLVVAAVTDDARA